MIETFTALEIMHGQAHGHSFVLPGEGTDAQRITIGRVTCVDGKYYCDFISDRYGVLGKLEGAADMKLRAVRIVPE